MTFYLMLAASFPLFCFILTQVSSEMPQGGGAFCCFAVNHQGELVPQGFCFSFYFLYSLYLSQISSFIIFF